MSDRYDYSGAEVANYLLDGIDRGFHSMLVSLTREIEKLVPASSTHKVAERMDDLRISIEKSFEESSRMFTSHIQTEVFKKPELNSHTLHRKAKVVPALYDVELRQVIEEKARQKMKKQDLLNEIARAQKEIENLREVTSDLEAARAQKEECDAYEETIEELFKVI